MAPGALRCAHCRAATPLRAPLSCLLPAGQNQGDAEAQAGAVTTAAEPGTRVPVPRQPDADYTDQAARRRREFVRARTGADLTHVGSYSFDPGVLPGNIENFTGVAQVPPQASFEP